jgi:hypothetical protein
MLFSIDLENFNASGYCQQMTILGADLGQIQE